MIFSNDKMVCILDFKNYPHFLCGLVWITVDRANLVTINQIEVANNFKIMCIILSTVEKAQIKDF